MCLDLKRGEPLRVAATDIQVVKYLAKHYGAWRSPYKEFTYRWGEAMQVEAGKWQHSKAMASGLSYELGGWSYIEHGFHTYPEPVHGYRWCRVRLPFRAVIPAGAEYYLGGTVGALSYCSNQLIVYPHAPYHGRREPRHREFRSAVAA